MANWDMIHQELQSILSKEVALRQEILSNMNQQEYVLLIGDTQLKNELHIECNKLAHRLKDLSKTRGTLTRQLFDILPPGIPGIMLDEILNPLEEIEEETLLLYKKAKELTEKIHSQHLRNKTLHEMIQKEGPLDVDNTALRAEAVRAKQGKKPTLITIDYPEEKNEG